jgi:hypothetical protein
MGMMDDMKNKAKDAMDDPGKKEKIEQMARDKGISKEEAKARFMNKDSE